MIAETEGISDCNRCHGWMSVNALHCVSSEVIGHDSNLTL